MNLTLSNQYNFLNRFIRLSFANIVSNLMIPLAGSISLVFLGHLSELHDLAGPSFAVVLFDFIYYGFYFLRQSTTGVTAQAIGREDQAGMLLIGLRNILIALVLGILILILQYPLREIAFALLSETPEVKASAVAYFNARIVGAPAVFINYVLIGWLLGREESGKVLLLSLIGNAANVGLDYLLIMHWGWGATGAGLSTAVSQYLMLLVGLIFFCLQIRWQELQAITGQLFNLSALKSTFALNGNIFVSTFILISTTDLFSLESTTMGMIIFTEDTLMLQIIFLALYVVEGLGLATESLVGNFVGQGANEKLASLVKLSGQASLFVGLAFALVPALFPQRIFGLFTDHVEIISQIDTYVWWLPLFLMFSSVALALEGYFLGLAEVRTLRNINLTAITLGFVPLSVVAWQFHNNHLLWLAYTIFMAIRMVMLGIQVPRTLESDYRNDQLQRDVE
ncbi:guanitoxin biosynthesis MATE family efflux transporter GntT [Nostoc sp.]|uniref:guanitoxin biosynthesis MATE family efflux transporter GntT n=1 Tax=Nostoc sp. TaxID=1180 RepID=UPI002FF69E23